MIDDGGPISPTLPVHYGYPSTCEGAGYPNGTGMSLRDWFAGQAMAGWLASCVAEDFHPARHRCAVPVRFLAFCSYDIADAMLEERQRRQEQTETATPPGDETCSASS